MENDPNNRERRGEASGERRVDGRQGGLPVDAVSPVAEDQLHGASQQHTDSHPTLGDILISYSAPELQTEEHSVHRQSQSSGATMSDSGEGQHHSAESIPQEIYFRAELATNLRYSESDLESHHSAGEGLYTLTEEIRRLDTHPLANLPDLPAVRAATDQQHTDTPPISEVVRVYLDVPQRERGEPNVDDQLQNSGANMPGVGVRSTTLVSPLSGGSSSVPLTPTIRLHDAQDNGPLDAGGLATSPLSPSSAVGGDYFSRPLSPNTRDGLLSPREQASVGQSPDSPGSARSVSSQSSSGSFVERMTSALRSAFSSTRIENELSKNGRKVEPLDVTQGFTARIVNEDKNNLYVEDVRINGEPLTMAGSSQDQGMPRVLRISKKQHPGFKTKIGKPTDIIEVTIPEARKYEVNNLSELDRQRDRQREEALEDVYNVTTPTTKFVAKVSQVIGDTIYAHRTLEMMNGLDGQNDRQKKLDLFKVDISVYPPDERPKGDSYVLLNPMGKGKERTVFVAPINEKTAMDLVCSEYEIQTLKQASILEPSKAFSGAVANVFGTKAYIRQDPERAEGQSSMFTMTQDSGLVKVDISCFPKGKLPSIGDKVKGTVTVNDETQARTIVVHSAAPQEIAQNDAGRSATKNLPLVPTDDSVELFYKMGLKVRRDLLNYLHQQCPNATKFSFMCFSPLAINKFTFSNDVVKDGEADAILIVGTPKNRGGNQQAIAKVFIAAYEQIDTIIAAREAMNNSPTQNLERRAGRSNSLPNDGNDRRDNPTTATKPRRRTQ